ncbi:hypothetical protein PHYBLDRAFT_160862 [Phycomyces blakesleeanus NRRL 1555(-)]|uniref:Uncharacterized protein n=1 Tax=Phycomyces blakesleeanus (strain ATCC 8743b / DSM 1359 / FGSC 10004 / NBRC 33097 / NRRL 1555) TaxID=763407 RepID=A0A162T0K1_PHYB8|nr:hypothetical protein PHYBLDRAFT_160862 [Phycomyces blakesleeanus NRRL 1555(-)]OAD65262.1 hypothetical protein PHYBLDRAFT_160862 [Phycomyces blakesleeanus NRRL 1555(-)]|eukprot:XP_018283302.1 hypothetical protein PHYBLDRAFT_160862 [Phycomyces blakesleeanus NRRL 1555(-)]
MFYQSQPEQRSNKQPDYKQEYDTRAANVLTGDQTSPNFQGKLILLEKGRVR